MLKMVVNGEENEKVISLNSEWEEELLVTDNHGEIIVDPQDITYSFGQFMVGVVNGNQQVDDSPYLTIELDDLENSHFGVMFDKSAINEQREVDDSLFVELTIAYNDIKNYVDNLNALLSKVSQELGYSK